MKIRTSHVTNSSSSSFAILAASGKDFRHSAATQGIALLDVVRKLDPTMDETMTESDLTEIFQDYDLLRYGEYGPSEGAGFDDGLIGKNLSSMPRNVTLAQYAEQAVKEIKEKTGVEMDPDCFHVCHEGWYNG